MLSQRLAEQFAKRKAVHQTRELEARIGPQGRLATIGSDNLLNFCSNDYLGLANHPDVIASLGQAAQTSGVGSGASQLVSGRSDCHAELEAAIASWLGFEDCVILSTGYMANLAMLTTLIARHDHIWHDRDNHASLIDAVLATGTKHQRYPHCDPSRIQPNPEHLNWLITDAVFSMDGRIAPLSDLTALANNEHTELLIDDAHGLGVLGSQGRGSLAHLNLAPSSVTAMVGTFGKALGTFGGFIVGKQLIINAVRQFARPYIYTTALPPALIKATQTSLAILQAEPERQTTLQNRITLFQSLAKQTGLAVLPSQTAIQGIVIGDSQAAMTASQALRERGIWLKAMRPPTVARGTSRLRIVLSASHTESDIDQLIEALQHV